MQDGSGFLSADEIAAAVGDMSSMSADDIKAMIQEHDVNGDGVIDYTGESMCRLSWKHGVRGEC